MQKLDWKNNHLEKWLHSNFGIISMIALVVFSAEFAIMNILELFPSIIPWQENLIDSISLTIVMAVFCLIIFRAKEISRQAAATRAKEAHQLLEIQKNALDLHSIVSFADLNGNITYANRLFQEISQYSIEELLGKNHRIIKSDKHPAEFYQRIWEQITQGQIWRGEVCNCAKDGSYYWVNATICPVLDEQDRVISYVSIRTDITKRKKMEENIRSSQVRYHKLFENLAQGVLVQDAEGKIFDINPAACNILGLTFNEALGRYSNDDYWMIVDENNKPFDKEKLPSHIALQSKKSIKGAVIGLIDAKTQRKKWVQIDALPVSLDSENIDSIYVVLTDITLQLKSEQEMRSLNEELALSVAKSNFLAQEAQKANQSKSIFLATMSHEIRTPLNGILGLTSILSETKLDQNQKELCSLTIVSGEHLLTVVNDILDFSKIEAGKIEVENTPFNLFDLLHQIEAIMHTRAAEKSLELHINIDQQTPNYVFGDPSRLRQVLFNLIGNAIKFTTKGSVTLKTEVINKIDSQSHIRFSVIDTGIGISQSKIPLLFRSFSQVDASIARQFGGTGLGLAISKGLIEAMGGEVGVNSCEGQGSVFWAKIPFTETNESESNLNKIDIKHKLGQGRVLLAEDNPINRKVATTMLKTFGIEYDIAENGLEVISKCRIHEYQLVLLDIQMPVLDGIEAFLQLKEIKHSLPNPNLFFVAMTANAMITEKQQYLDLGMNDHMPKPFKKEDLYNILTRWLA